MWFELAAPNPIPSTISINPWLTCKPRCQFLCLHNPTAPCRQKHLRAAMKPGRSGSEKPSCWDFLKAFHHAGNKLTVQTEVPVLWQLGNPTHGPTAAAPPWGLSSGITFHLAFPRLWLPKRGSLRSWAVLGMWMGTAVMEDCKTQQCKPLGQGRERLEADRWASTGELLWRHWGHWPEQALQKCFFCTIKGVQWTLQTHFLLH